MAADKLPLLVLLALTIGLVVEAAGAVFCVVLIVIAMLLLAPRFSIGKPRNHVELTTRLPSGRVPFQSLRVKWWLGFGSRYKARWWFGFINWKEEPHA